MLCFLCLNNLDESNVTQLFTNNEESEIANIIKQNKLIEITMEDISASICSICSLRLNDFIEFCRYIKERQHAFAPKLKNEFIENNCEELIVLGDFRDAEENLNELISTSPLLESELDCPEYYNIDDEENILNVKGEKDVLTTDDTTACLNKNITSAKHKTKGTLGKRNLIKNCNKKLITLQKNENLMDTVESKQQSSESDEFIAQNLEIKCEICSVIEPSFFKLQLHYRAAHNCAGYLVCCGIQFMKRLRLIEHIKLHINPDHYKCKECGKKLKTRRSLFMHMMNTHPNPDDVRHECEICNKSFSTKSYLQSHKRTHDEQKKFRCEICTKCFKTKQILETHIDRMHENPQPLVCDICGREYRFKPSFDRHVAEHKGPLAREDLQAQCPICLEWYFKTGLRKHIERHNKISIECTKCGKQFATKSALTCHIQYNHKRTNKFQCTYCDKAFKLQNVLKEHIATHTGVKDHKCPHCPQEFRSKSNMYAHVKKCHVEEWSQKKKPQRDIPPASVYTNSSL